MVDQKQPTSLLDAAYGLSKDPGRAKDQFSFEEFDLTQMRRDHPLPWSTAARSKQEALKAAE